MAVYPLSPVDRRTERFSGLDPVRVLLPGRLALLLAGWSSAGIHNPGSGGSIPSPATMTLRGLALGLLQWVRFASGEGSDDLPGLPVGSAKGEPAPLRG